MWLTYNFLCNIIYSNQIYKYKIEVICILENYFESINSKDRAYFLGFLLGDSHINIISDNNKILDITIHPDDHEILDLFCKYIQCEKLPKLCFSKSKKRNKIYKRYRLILRSKKIVNDLVNNYGGALKEQRLNYNIPKELLSHFIRGIFDADGGISSWFDKNSNKQRYEISISGRYELLKKILCDVGFDNQINIVPDKSIFRIRTTDINIISKFLNYIYKDSENLRLERKYNIAQEVLRGLPQVKNRGKSVKAAMLTPRGLSSVVLVEHRG